MNTSSTIRHIRLTVLLMTALAACPAIRATNPGSRINRSLATFSDVMRTIDNYYVDTINYEQLTQTAISSMLYKIDPYTTFIPEERESDIDYMQYGTYAGVGCVIRAGKDGRVFFERMFKDKPAQRAGIRSGDILLEIDGKDIKGMKLEDVRNMLRGKANQNIRIKVERAGEKKPITFEFMREIIQTDAVSYAAVVAPHTGYVRYTDFTEGSAILLRNAIRDLTDKDSIDRLIIDLRDNGGGLMDEACQIMSYFVPKGTPVVSTRGRHEDDHYTYKTTTEPIWPDMKLVILVNDNTASASEIVSGAMQDLDRAVIVGERTYGKGLVQRIIPIRHNGNVKVTISKYYIPSGRCIQAIDYSKRDRQGRVSEVPDSLTHEFKTRAGRTVRDGRGILPDIISSDSGSIGISYALYSDNIFFDYSVRYAATHAAPASADGFTVTDSLLRDFTQYVEDRKYTYKTESEEYFESLRQMMRYERLDSMAQEELKALHARISPTIREAIERDRENVEHYLGAEIVERYYYEHGLAAYMLGFDKDFKRAVELIGNDDRMQRILKGK